MEAVLAGPLSRERLKAALDALQTRYRTDEDGEFSGWWGDNQFTNFAITGNQSDVLHIMSSWRPEPPLDLLDRLVSASNAWNLERFWPKAYVQVREATVRIQTEHNVDCEGGVSDLFLQKQLRCAVGTTSQFFEHLESLYPEHPAWSEA